MRDFAVGQKVVHVREGLSEIVDTKIMNEREFFVVRVCRGGGETIYVPKQGSSPIIREILNKDEADALLKQLKTIQKDFNTNTKQRRDAYKRCLSSGKIEDMGYLYRQYYLYKKYPEGVKLGPADNDMLSYATSFICDELSITYHIPNDEIEKFLADRIESL